MRSHHRPVILLLLLLLSPPPYRRWSAAAVGVNWGTTSSHPLPPVTVVHGILLANNIDRVKVSDADPGVLQSLAGSGVGVVVGIPNEMLRALNASKAAARSWVKNNVTRYLSGGVGVGGGRVRIEYIAVGDEPFLVSYGQQFQPFVVGAAINIQLALDAAKLEDKIKLIVPCDSDVYQSKAGLPSGGHFRPDLNKTMIELLTFLTKHESPFVLDINPFLNIGQNKNLSMSYYTFQPGSHSLVDSHNTYKNSFDASIDTLSASLSKAGFDDMDIIVGRIGWPTDGAVNATSSTAQTFMQGLLDHLKKKSGTPLRPKRPPTETYIFSLLDEDQRSISTGNFERHRGIFTFDGQAKYNVDLGQGSKKLENAHGVGYLASKWCVANNNKDLSNVSSSVSEACSSADCTAISAGGSCFGVGLPGNVSYAFNSYYQQHDQNADSCDFGGLGLITTVDPSVDDCRFTIALQTSFSSSIHGMLLVQLLLLLLLSSYISALNGFA